MTMQATNRTFAKLPLSMLFMGATQIKRGYQVKGLLFFTLQILALLMLPDIIIAIQGLISLGDVAQSRKGFRVLFRVTTQYLSC